MGQKSADYNRWLKAKKAGTFTGDFSAWSGGSYDKRGVRSSGGRAAQTGRLSGDATNWFSVAEQLYGRAAGGDRNLAQRMAQRLAAANRGVSRWYRGMTLNMPTFDTDAYMSGDFYDAPEPKATLPENQAGVPGANGPGGTQQPPSPGQAPEDTTFAKLLNYKPFGGMTDIASQYGVPDDLLAGQLGMTLSGIGGDRFRYGYQSSAYGPQEALRPLAPGPGQEHPYPWIGPPQAQAMKVGDRPLGQAPAKKVLETPLPYSKTGAKDVSKAIGEGEAGTLRKTGVEKGLDPRYVRPEGMSDQAWQTRVGQIGRRENAVHLLYNIATAPYKATAAVAGVAIEGTTMLVNDILGVLHTGLETAAKKDRVVRAEEERLRQEQFEETGVLEFGHYLDAEGRIHTPEHLWQAPGEGYDLVGALQKDKFGKVVKPDEPAADTPLPEDTRRSVAEKVSDYVTDTLGLDFDDPMFAEKLEAFQMNGTIDDRLITTLIKMGQLDLGPSGATSSYNPPGSYGGGYSGYGGYGGGGGGGGGGYAGRSPYDNYQGSRASQLMGAQWSF